MAELVPSSRLLAGGAADGNKVSSPLLPMPTPTVDGEDGPPPLPMPAVDGEDGPPPLPMPAVDGEDSPPLLPKPRDLDGDENKGHQGDQYRPPLLRQSAPAAPPAHMSLPFGDGDDEDEENQLSTPAAPPADMSLPLGDGDDEDENQLLLPQSAPTAPPADKSLFADGDDEDEEKQLVLRQSAPAAPPGHMNLSLGDGDHDDEDEEKQLLLRQSVPAAPPAHMNPSLGDGDEADQTVLLQPAQVKMFLMLGALTLMILGIIMVSDLGIHPSKWGEKMTAKTSKEWLRAGFVAAGSISSLVMSYSRVPIYVGMWRDGAAGTLARVVPSVVSLLNCLVWVVYGFLLHPANMPMIIVNLTGATFHTIYICMFVVYSNTQNKMWVLLMLLLAAGAGLTIAAVDLHGMELPDAVGWSAVTTACMMYVMPFIVLAGQVWVSGTTAAVPNLVVLGATCLNALLWLIDGFVVHNNRLMAAHGAGVLSCLVQAAIYVWCSKINSRKATRSTSSVARTPPLQEPLIHV